MRLWPRRSTSAALSPTPMNQVLDTLSQLGFDPGMLDNITPGEVYFPLVGGNLEAREAIQRAASEFAIMNNVAVFMCNPHCQATPPINLPGTVHIRFWSRASDAFTPRFAAGSPHRTTVPARTLGGLCDGAQMDALHPSRRGQQLVLGSVTVGEVVDNTIYVLYDLPHCHDSSCRRVQNALMQILEAALPFLDMAWTDGTIDPETALAEQRTRFATAAVSALTQRTAHMDRELARIDALATEQALALMTANQQREQLLLDRFRLMERDPAADLAAQFDAILAMPEVENIAASNTGVNIYTGDIILTHEGRRHRMGKFRIAIKFARREDEATLNIINLTRPMSGYQHPHVSQGGTPCLGNIAREIPTLVAQGMIKDLVELIISFLQSYNSSSPFISLQYWR